jgi:hypothetical protein
MIVIKLSLISHFPKKAGTGPVTPPREIVVMQAENPCGMKISNLAPAPACPLSLIEKRVMESIHVPGKARILYFHRLPVQIKSYRECPPIRDKDHQVQISADESEKEW